MSTHLNGFNRVARAYDVAKRTVFGKAIYESKTHFIKAGYTGRNILIVGGGSGETLPLLLKLNAACRIWFVDASSEMLTLARRRMGPVGNDNILFIHSTKDQLPEGVVFDTVITDFILDLFSDREVARMSRSLTGRLRPGGTWLVADFVDGGKQWQKMMLWLMYRFFGAACGIEATRLPSWQHHIEVAGMEKVSDSTFYGGFIRSIVYRKISDFQAAG